MSTLLPPDLEQLWLKDPSVLSAARIRRSLLKSPLPPPENRPSIRAAFIGSFTLDPVRDTFEAACLHDGIQPVTFLGAYQQYAQELLDGGGALYAFRPELTFLALDPWTVFGDLCFYPPDNPQAQREAFQAFMDRLAALIRKFDAMQAGLLVIHNLAPPPFDAAGGIGHAVREFNDALAALARDFSRVFILDYAAIAARCGLAAHDDKLRLLGRFCVGNAAVPALARAQLGLVKALKGLTRKAIVLDLDNTLWGGVVGEDGLDGIALGPTPPGNAYWEFQKTLLGYYRRGVVLAICSRNNPEDVLRVLREHPWQVLREEHFGALVINWADKATGLAQVARELNLGLDALVFVDDDPHNRQLVRQALPQVLVPELPEDPSAYPRALLELNDFETLTLTAEDLQRGRMMAAERSRRAAREGSIDLDAFLRDLQTTLRIGPADSFAIPRIAQLTQRTNQFNMTTRRYSPAEIEAYAARAGTRVYSLQASDRYGDSGLVGAAILKLDGERWALDTFLLSCRVLGRRIEDGFLWWIAAQARKAGAHELAGEILYTPKNLPARDFFQRMGFTIIEDSDRGQRCALDLARLPAAPPPGITIHEGADACRG